MCIRDRFTDRGNGFYNPGTGAITNGYRAALRGHQLQAFFPASASIQPCQLQELMLHETAVSWVRDRLKKTLPRKCWEETEEAYGARLKEAAPHINSTHGVEGLCMEFPGCLENLSPV